MDCRRLREFSRREGLAPFATQSLLSPTLDEDSDGAYLLIDVQSPTVLIFLCHFLFRELLSFLIRGVASRIWDIPDLLEFLDPGPPRRREDSRKRDYYYPLSSSTSFFTFCVLAPVKASALLDQVKSPYFPLSLHRKVSPRPSTVPYVRVELRSCSPSPRLVFLCALPANIDGSPLYFSLLLSFLFL